MIVPILLFTVHISCAAVLPMMKNIMDPQLIAIDDVQGFLYEVPEYEDPLMVEHQLSSIGAMPIFTLLEAAKKHGNPKADLDGMLDKENMIDDMPEKMKVVETRKTLEEIISRLQIVKTKLERGSGNIHKDLERVTQSLKTLEKTARPDMRQMLNTLQSVMTRARPLMMPQIIEQITTAAPESSEKSSFFEKPTDFDRQAISVRVISPKKTEFQEKPVFTSSFGSAQSMSDEKSIEEEKLFEDKSMEDKVKGDKSMDEKSEEEKSMEEKVEDERYIEDKVGKQNSPEDKSKSWESAEISKESYEATKSPYELKINEKKNTNFEGDDVLATYKAKVTWKSAGII